MLLFLGVFQNPLKILQKHPASITDAVDPIEFQQLKYHVDDIHDQSNSN
jgi:hypothetical protein